MSPALAGGFLTTAPPGKPRLTFFSWEILRDPVLVRSGSSTDSLALHHPQVFPAASPLGCFVQRRTKPPPQPRPWAQQPSTPQPNRKLPPGRGIRRTARGEAPTRVHGCPLVAVRGSGLQVGASQLLTFRPALSIPGQLGRARGRSQLGELTAGSIGQGPWEK